MSLFFSKIKGLFEGFSKINQFIGAIVGAIYIIVTILTPSINWIYKQISKEDVTAIVYPLHTHDDLLKIIRDQYKNDLSKYFSDEKELKELIKAYKQEPGGSDVTLVNPKTISHFVEFGLRKYSPWSDDLLMVDLRNNKNKKLRRVSISIPGFHSVKGIKVITSALHPDKVSELQTSWSLSKDKSVLFLKEIGELPPLTEIQCYIFGDYLPGLSAFFEPVNISLEAGSTKVIREMKVIPGLMEYPRWIRFPSLDTIFIAGIFALVWYLVFVIKRKVSVGQKS